MRKLCLPSCCIAVDVDLVLTEKAVTVRLACLMDLGLVFVQILFVRTHVAERIH
jgi:hypothetical protein